MVVRAFRALDPGDLDPPLSAQRLGDLLQLLIAHGDADFVQQLTRLVQHRVAWVLERDATPRPK